MNRNKRIQQIRQKLAGRSLVWFGTRVTDGLSLTDIPELKGLFGLICPCESIESITHYCVEEHKALRVDLNRYNIDDDESVEIRFLIEKMLSVLKKPSVIVSYRPSQLLASIYFPGQKDIIDYWGMFHLKQMSLEYKPWVEIELSKNSVKTIPWRYYSDREVNRFQKEMFDVPVVLRLSRGSGGAGIIIAKSAGDVAAFCHDNTEGFFSASIYLEPNIPFSINGVVFNDGTVTVFPPSVQIIGLSECTNRNMGFCGNDFGTIKDLPLSIIEELEKMTIAAGKWLYKTGYLGVFGIDALLFEEEIYLVEINPRFLASSPIASLIDRRQNMTDVYLEHIAAYAGLEPIKPIPLVEQVRQQDQISQLICYNRGTSGIRRLDSDITPPEGVILCEVPSSKITVEPEGEIFKCIFNRSITDNGLRLNPEISSQIKDLTSQWIYGSLE